MDKTSLSKYLSLVKFSHTIFAMPFAILGLTLGFMEKERSFSWQTTVLVLLCMVLARNAAMAFNRWTDRTIDAKNPRTATREIPAGIITDKHAFAFVIINSCLFIIATYFINWLCFILSPVALAVILGYSYTKRFSSISHIILGLGLALAPIGAYLAVTGFFSIIPILLGFVVLFWVAGFDIIYALQDVEFDRNEHLHSIPVFFGKSKALAISRILHVLAVICLVIIGAIGQVGWLYWIGVGIFLTLLIYQHSIVKTNDLSRVNLAFFTSNGIASMVFALCAIADLLYTNQVITV